MGLDSRDQGDAAHDRGRGLAVRTLCLFIQQGGDIPNARVLYSIPRITPASGMTIAGIYVSAGVCLPFRSAYARSGGESQC